jgi:hypothetical protein
MCPSGLAGRPIGAGTSTWRRLLVAAGVAVERRVRALQEEELFTQLLEQMLARHKNVGERQCAHRFSRGLTSNLPSAVKIAQGVLMLKKELGLVRSASSAWRCP